METGLVTYAASTSWSAIHVRRRTRRPAPTASWSLINSDDADAVGAVRRPDLDLVAHAVPDQRLAECGLIADAARLRVRLGGADDAVGLLRFFSVLLETHRAAHRHEAGCALALDQDVVLEDHLELLDPRLLHALLVLGGVVLEVLGKVAELAGGLDLGGDLRPPVVDQLVVLLAHGLQALAGDVDVFSHRIECRATSPLPLQRIPLPLAGAIKKGPILVALVAEG